jgi:hypothetical protein
MKINRGRPMLSGIEGGGHPSDPATGSRAGQGHPVDGYRAGRSLQSDMNKAARDHADTVGKKHPVSAPHALYAAALRFMARVGDYIVGETIGATEASSTRHFR